MLQLLIPAGNVVAWGLCLQQWHACTYTRLLRHVARCMCRLHAGLLLLLLQAQVLGPKCSCLLLSVLPPSEQTIRRTTASLAGLYFGNNALPLARRVNGNPSVQLVVSATRGKGAEPELMGAHQPYTHVPENLITAAPMAGCYVCRMSTAVNPASLCVLGVRILTMGCNVCPSLFEFAPRPQQLPPLLNAMPAMSTGTPVPLHVII